MRLLVTRPQPQADEWVAALHAAGFDAAALPLLAIAAPEDAAAVQAAAARLPALALVVFVSPNAAQRFFDTAAPVHWPPGPLAAAPGPGTAQMLRALGVPAEAIVEPPAGAAQFDSEALWQVLQPRRDWAGAEVLLVRGDGGREFLADALRAQGAQVQALQAYRREAPAWSSAQRALLDAALAAPAEHLWLLSSSEALEHLDGLLPEASWAASQAVCTHERIAARARSLGFGRVDCIAPGLDTLERHLRQA
jgi:uroporphyrinogen-III synthase